MLNIANNKNVKIFEKKISREQNMRKGLYVSLELEKQTF